MPPRVLLLDVMETLVHDPFFVEIPSFFGLSVEEILRDKHPTAWVDFELGKFDASTFARRFFADGRPVDADGLRRAVIEAYRFLPGIEPLLTELRAARVPMHTLSNYPDWYRWVEDKVELSRYVEWSFVSCRVGMRKPDPELFRHAARDLDQPCEACLFVDDREENCEGARAVGMDAIRFVDAQQLRAALVDRGIAIRPVVQADPT